MQIPTLPINNVTIIGATGRQNKTIRKQVSLEITSQGVTIPLPFLVASGLPVSYTHLDVYKRQVLFCLPVAPMIVTLFIGRVGICMWLPCCILFNSTWSTKEILDPVSIIMVDVVPFIWALMYTISLFLIGIELIFSSINSSLIFFK